MSKTTPNESSRQNDSGQWVDNRWSRKRWILPGTLALILIAVISAIGPLNILTSVVISLSEDTEYSAGYSESAFQEVEVGAGEAAVRSVLGAPLKESAAKPYMRWLYTPTTEPAKEFEENGGYPDIRFSFTTVDFGEDGLFADAFGQISHDSTSTPLGASISATILTDGANSLSLSDAEIEKLKTAQATAAQIEARFGRPQAVFESSAVKWLQYSRSPGSKDYRQRLIGIDRDGKVCRKVDTIWWD